MGEEGIADHGDLRRLGGVLSGIGTPWVLTIFGLSGLAIDERAIVPLLWFAPPFIFVRLYGAARCVTPKESQIWWTTLGVGVSTWAVATWGPILSSPHLADDAHGIGVVAGSLLFCTAMLSLVRSIGWTEHVRHWRSARRTMAVSIVAALVAIGLDQLGDLAPDGQGVAASGWAVIIGVWSAVIGVVALFRIARILRATRAGLLAVPDEARWGDLFSTGSR